MSSAKLILNFHGVGEPTREINSSEHSVWISLEQFKRILDWAQEVDNPSSMQITFDDGNVSDRDIALDELTKRGLSASFFILTGKFNETGYVTQSDLSIFRKAEMSIGSHGINHVDWRKLELDALLDEVNSSKKCLEDILGDDVTTVGIPFGSYDRRTLKIIRNAGYSAAYTSDGGPAALNRWLQPRLSIRRDTTLQDIETAFLERDSLKSHLNISARVLLKSWR